MSGVLYALIFPKFNFSFLSFFFLVPLLLYIFKNPSESIKNIFFKSWIAGTICYIILLYWVFYPLWLSGAGILGASAGVFFLALYLGLYWAVFGISIYYIKKNRFPLLIFLIPAFWIFLEFVRAHLLSGFPWLLAGYSLWKIPYLIQLADITGVYGISFLVVLINTVISLTIFRKSLKPVLRGVPVFILVSFYPFLGGNVNTGSSRRISILQGNISQYEKWNSDYEQNILDTYRNLHKKAVKFNPEIIVWPETSLPGVLLRDSDLVNYMRELSENSGAVEIVGSMEQDRERIYNSAYSIKKGKISSPYRKVHLTPFGEFIPFRSFFSLFIGVVNEIGDFHSGENIDILPAGDFQAGTAICFESIFPYIAREFFKQGAQLYVNITNDGWFLDSAGPEQHFIHSVFRSVENRKYTVRAANTGISGIISPFGKIKQRTELMKAEVVNGTVYTSNQKTFYTKYGDVFVYFCIIILLIIPVFYSYSSGKILKDI
ncbi:MAG: apolipoprotein N-acyltransferase [Elusimicrobiota bacterium]